MRREKEEEKEDDDDDRVYRKKTRIKCSIGIRFNMMRGR